MARVVCSFALYLTFIAVIDSHPLHPHHLAIPPEGITFQIKIKPELNTHGKQGPMMMEVSVKEMNKPIPPPHPKPQVKHPEIEPAIEDRFGVRAGTCPIGYVKRGGFCFPDNDYD